MKRLLVVFKKNHEEVHDSALRTVISILEERREDGEIQYRTVARESVSREDFIGPEVVILLGGDGTLTSISYASADCRHARPPSTFVLPEIGARIDNCCSK